MYQVTCHGRHIIRTLLACLCRSKLQKVLLNQAILLDFDFDDMLEFCQSIKLSALSEFLRQFQMTSHVRHVTRVPF